MFLVVLLTKLFVLRGKNAAYEFIKAILKEYEYCKKIMKNILKKT